MCLLCAVAAAAPLGTAARSAAPAARLSAASADYLVARFVRPVLFSFYGINVYSYGIMVSTALATAFWCFAAELRRARIDLDEIHCFFVFLVGFAVGSKSHLALSALGAGEELSWAALDLRTGHSFIGSQLGAVLAMLVYIKWNHVGVMLFLDVLLPCCMLGHVIGKGGCFLSGDGCYGPPADPRSVPWAMSFPNALVPTWEPVHPTPVYESICSFLVFAVVRGLLPLPRADSAEGDRPGRFPPVGRRTAAVLVLYGLERVSIEPYRRHPPISLFGGLTEYQVLAVVLLAIGIMIEAWSRLQGQAYCTGGGKAHEAKNKKND